MRGRVLPRGGGGNGEGEREGKESREGKREWCILCWEQLVNRKYSQKNVLNDIEMFCY